MSEFDDLAQRATSVFHNLKPAHLGLAVSGGGDSLAMLHLLVPWAKDQAVRLSVATVDHGLRPEAAAEAAMVGRICQTMGVSHAVLRWTGWDRKGNLQDQARRARQRLLQDWARSDGVDCIALGHTKDDQAENFLLRLARGSGVDGLSGMRAERRLEGIRWVRPLLGLGRAELRGFLREKGEDWIEDPSNDDPRFARVKVRRILADLQPAGLSAEDLVATSGRLQMARDALEYFAQKAARDCMMPVQGDVVLMPEPFFALPGETQLRLLAHAICWVASAEYRPRLQALESALADVRKKSKRSLHGTLLIPGQSRIRIVREFGAVAGRTGPPDRLWDGRWRVSGPGNKTSEVRALGEAGLKQCPNWRDSGLPRVSLLSSPSIWEGDRLIAAPVAGFRNGWVANLVNGEEHFFSSILSH